MTGEITQNMVLVEVDEIENLKAAYPGYFGDVQLFLHHLQTVMHGQSVSCLSRRRMLSFSDASIGRIRP